MLHVVVDLSCENFLVAVQQVLFNLSCKDFLVALWQVVVELSYEYFLTAETEVVELSCEAEGGIQHKNT